MYSLFVNVFVGSIAAESPLSKALSWPLARAIFGWVTDSAASGTDDAVGHVGAVLALPSFVVLSSAVGASHKTWKCTSVLPIFAYIFKSVGLLHCLHVNPNSDFSALGRILVNFLQLFGRYFAKKY